MHWKDAKKYTKDATTKKDDPRGFFIEQLYTHDHDQKAILCDVEYVHGCKNVWTHELCLCKFFPSLGTIC